MSKEISEKNSLWVALNFVFPKLQGTGEEYVPKSMSFKVFVDEQAVGEVTKGDSLTFMSNMKLGCKVDILKGDVEKANVLSSFSWIVGEEYGTLYLNKDDYKKVKMNFQNKNRVEVYDERDWDYIDKDGEVVNKKTN